MKASRSPFHLIAFLALIGLSALLAACASGPAVALPTLAPTSPPILPVAPASEPVSVPESAPLEPGAVAPVAVAGGLLVAQDPVPSATAVPTATPTPSPTATPTHPLMIEVMRRQSYPGSEITFEETLDPGSNYDRYIVSYRSEGNKIYALLTIPRGERPPSGWPVVIFNHGYIPPAEYRTTERYVAYVDAFARSGYIVFRSDYRGHGNSEGEAGSSYSSPAYTIDVLNGLASVRRLPEADPERIGMWGHSMGGHITLRAMVVTDDVKAGVIWAGVVASYADLFENWRRRFGDGPTPTPNPTSTRGRWRDTLVATYGTIEENPDFWNAISANSYVSDLSGPLQLHHGTADSSVPVAFSEKLAAQVEAAGLPVELYLYEGDNHNISANLATALARSVAFFDRFLK